MGSFTNLIQQLPPNNDGKDFERLSKWILETAPQYKSLVDQVWLWDEWPDKWGPDTGIDIVARTKEGKYWAVQCKAYDPEYSITKSDIDSFVSESARSQFSYRLLIATTDRIGSNARRTIEGVTPPCSTLLRTDLDSLPIDWPNSFNDFGSAVPHVPWTPREHQNEALENIVNGLQTSDRGKVVMPCGSGKTLVALWASERLKSQSVLVLVPSISLMKQTIGEWSANSNEPMTYLAVCSDSQVTAEERSDSIVSSTSDVPFPVTTDPDHIARYLDSAGKKVVFSTYQSSPSVSEAQRITNSSEFDLVIADEAHRCAGRVSKTFSTVLDNTKIPASKRIFMTATPRYFTGRVVKEADEEDIEIASMDDPEQFGDTLHTLSFSKAISDDLLCDYQVLVVGVDDETVKAYAENGHFVTLDGNTVTDAKILASQIALAKSMKRHDLKRVLTFHNRIKNASEFAGKFLEVIDWMPDEDIPSGLIDCDHVSGKMNAGVRAAKLNTLRNLDGIDRSLVTNARCLAEGVDVPALDAVGFIDPKRSQIDIVQAVGRVMRTADDKTIGTIVVPVFINESDDPDTILQDSAFDTVWQVIKAIRSHDEEIAEILDQLRRESGRTGQTITTADFGDKIIFDLPTKVDAAFSNRLSTRIVELSTSSWEYGFGQLKKFAEREGHGLVPSKHVEDDFNLGSWCASQRGVYLASNRTVSNSQIDLLESIPFWVWRLRDGLWDYRFSKLVRFVEREGHALVLLHHKDEDFELGSWCQVQRTAYKSGHISNDKIDRLESMPNWRWTLPDVNWNIHFRILEKFLNENGSNVVEKSTVVKDTIAGKLKIGEWASNQRQAYRRDELDQDYIQQLESLGTKWQWSVRGSLWETNFSALNQFVAREGHSSVAYDQVENGVTLGGWVVTQRSNYRRGILSKSRIQRIQNTSDDWSWNPHKDSWADSYKSLLAYVASEDNVFPSASTSDSEHEKNLGIWCYTQRKNYSQGLLSQSKINELEKIEGWIWSRQSHWDKGLRHMKTFVEREGHALVAQTYKENGYGLGYWVSFQRGKFNKVTLSQTKIDELNSLGFIWDAQTYDWDEGIDHFKRFVEREGHTRVPQGLINERGFRLGTWVTGRRRQYARGDLAQERIDVLNSLSFIWDANEYEWHQGLTFLKRFVEREAHAIVAKRHKEEGFSLGTWVLYRRQEYKQGLLSKEQISELNSLGFIWVVNEYEWQRGITLLKRFVEREAHAIVPQKHKEDGFNLGAWVSAKRNGYTKGILSQERIDELNRLGFVWDILEYRWHQGITLLKRFIEREAHAMVAKRHIEDGYPLGSWVDSKRFLNKEGTLTQQRIDELNKLGFVWDVREYKKQTKNMN